MSHRGGRLGLALLTLVLLTTGGGPYRAAFAQGLRAGKLDPTFSGNGKVYVTIGEFSDYARALTIQTDGKILMAGTANFGVSDSSIGLVRLLPDGSKDATFGRHGIVQTDLGPQDDAFDIALQGDGEIVVAGSDGNDIVVLRYRANGRLDPAFGNGGVATIDIVRYDVAMAVAVAPDGSILLTGQSVDTDRGRPVLARLLSDGSLDASFGESGLVIGRTRQRFAPEDLAIQPDGRIVVSGVHYPLVEVRRYLPNGRRDASFGTRGRVVTPLSPSMRTAVALRQDGGMLLTGSVGSNNGDFGIAALMPDGSPDEAFGTNGIAAVDFGGTFDQAMAVAIATDGAVVAAGDATNSGNRLFAVARLLPDGTPDPAFGDDGRVTTGGGELGFVQDLALDASGRIVAGGVASPRGDLRFMALRFLAA